MNKETAALTGGGEEGSATKRRGMFGEYTLWNRFLCLLRGHLPCPEPSHAATYLDSYFCVRCNDYALFLDRETGRWYLTFDAWWADLDSERIAKMRQEPFTI